MGSTSVIERAAEEHYEEKAPEGPNIPNIAASPYALNTPAHGNRHQYLPEAAEPDTPLASEPEDNSQFSNKTKAQLRKEIREDLHEEKLRQKSKAEGAQAQITPTRKDR